MKGFDMIHIGMTLCARDFSCAVTGFGHYDVIVTWAKSFISRFRLKIWLQPTSLKHSAGLERKIRRSLKIVILSLFKYVQLQNTGPYCKILNISGSLVTADR